MKTQNHSPLLLKLLLTLIVLTLIGCVSKHKIKQDTYNNEPVIAVDESLNQTTDADQNQPVQESNNDEPMIQESSGISAPSEEASMLVTDTNQNTTPAPEEEIPADSAMTESMPLENSQTETTRFDATMQHSGEPVFNSISEIPANYYAVQIVATSSMKNLYAFAKKHNLSKQLTTQTVVNGKTWNILLLGAYPTMAKAKAAMATVSDIVGTSPWIRYVNSVQ